MIVKGATLTYLISIYMGLIMVGFLMFPDSYSDISTQMMIMFENPVVGIPAMIINAFTGPNAFYIATSLTLGGVAIAITTALFGGGFTLLFALPLMIVVAVLNFLALPTAQILSSPLPDAAKWVWILFIGALNLVTALTFTAGRQ